MKHARESTKAEILSFLARDSSRAPHLVLYKHAFEDLPVQELLQISVRNDIFWVTGMRRVGALVVMRGEQVLDLLRGQRSPGFRHIRRFELLCKPNSDVTSFLYICNYLHLGYNLQDASEP